MWFEFALSNVTLLKPALLLKVNSVTSVFFFIQNKKSFRSLINLFFIGFICKYLITCLWPFCFVCFAHMFDETVFSNAQSNIYAFKLILWRNSLFLNSHRHKSTNYPIILQDFDIDRFWTNLETKKYKVLGP